MNLLAPTAMARAPAAVSAFRLKLAPSSPIPKEATTGMYPCWLRVVTSPALTSATSPTWPRSTSLGRLRATSIRPSFPLRPTACPPSRMMSDTSALLARPARTISTTSMVSGSVTRRPWTKVEGLPSRSSTRVISGPPPWTSTGWIPAPLSRTRSCASVPEPLSSTLPPNFTTTVFPFQALTYRSPWAMSSPWATAAWTDGSGHGPGIFPDVPLGEVARPHGRLALPEPQVHGDLDLLPLQVPGRLREALALRRGRAPLGQQDRPDPAREPVLLHLRARVAHGGQDPAPVGRAPVEGRLDERGRGDREGGLAGLLLAQRAADGHLHELRGAFAVARHHLRQGDAEGLERPLEGLQRLSRAGDLRGSRLAVGQQEHGVVGAPVPVHGDPVEGEVRRVG